MAWQHDGHRVATIGATHGSHCCRAPHPFRLFPIGSGLAVGNARQRIPHLYLKRSPQQVELHCKHGALTSEVLAELSLGSCDKASSLFAFFCRKSVCNNETLHNVVLELHTSEPTWRCTQSQYSNRRRDGSQRSNHRRLHALSLPQQWPISHHNATQL